MADRWNKTNLSDSRSVWLPLQFKVDKPIVEWFPSWDLSLFDKTQPAARQPGAGRKKGVGF